jgi:hypothetical protein
MTRDDVNRLEALLCFILASNLDGLAATFWWLAGLASITIFPWWERHRLTRTGGQ